MTVGKNESYFRIITGTPYLAHGVSNVRSLKKIERVITAPHCIKYMIVTHTTRFIVSRSAIVVGPSVTF